VEVKQAFLREIRDMKLGEGNQDLDLESQGYLLLCSTVMFGTNDGKDGVNGFIQVRITVQNDIIELWHTLELFPRSCDAGVQTFPRLCFALFETLN
jgi:hypothetical protein